MFKGFILVSLLFLLSFNSGAVTTSSYPRAFTLGTNNLKAMYLLGYVYHPDSQTYSLDSKILLEKAFTDKLAIEITNDYDTNDLLMNTTLTFFEDSDSALAMGYRNLGASQSSTESLPKEYLMFSQHYGPWTFDIGIQRISGEHQEQGFLGGIQFRVRQATFYIRTDHNILSTGFYWNALENISFSVERLIPGSEPDTPHAVAEAGVVLFTSLEDRFYDKPFDTQLAASPLILETAFKHIQKGTEYYYQGNLQQALSEYQLANSLNPDQALIHERMGSIYYQLKEIKQAIREWQQALKLDPDRREIRKYLLKLKLSHPRFFEEKGQ